MSNLYCFGDFVLDPARRMLCRVGAPVPLTPRAFDVLLFLVRNPNRPVLKEELLQAVWEKTFVEEGNLAQYISHLRKALGDNSENDRLIVTIAGKGYQFTGRVTVAAEGADAAGTAATMGAAAGEAPRTDVLPAEPLAKDKVDESSAGFGLRRWLAAAALLVVVTVAAWLYRSHRYPVSLSVSDTIVLGNFKNETSDPVFDDTLDTALRYEMEQTPYLNTLGNDKVLGTLAQLKLPPTTKLTPDVARQICGKTNSKLVIAPSISDAGNAYHLQLQALDCGSGATLAAEQANIGRRNEVVHELGVTAARVRAKLGEPTDSLARFNQPLEKALSASPEALQADIQGQRLYAAGDAAGAVKFFQRAAELDPDFSVTHSHMGAASLFLGNADVSVASYTRAYQLRERLTEKNRLNAEIDYYGRVTGDWEKEHSAVLRLLDLFPRDVIAHTNLRAAFVYLGQPDRAADEAAEVARLRPSAYYFGSAIQSIRFASRFNDAKSWIAKADSLKFDNSLIRRERLIVAFATGERDSVEKILKDEERGKYREEFLHEQSLIEAQRGHLDFAARLRHQAFEQNPKPGNDDWWVVLSALEYAEVGKEVQARRYQSEAAARKMELNNKIALALALARSGRTEQAGDLAAQISAEKPEGTLEQHYFLPTIRAAIKLQEHDPAGAIDLLRDGAKYDLAFTASFEYLYPAYIRGLAYMGLGDGHAAAGEFQKLIDHPGFMVRHVTGPLAWLQLGRAQKMMGDEAAARKSYETFLNLWKNADPGMPIYLQAKTEYARLAN
jgi:eukaryotic-like serine/threonine-protein kinase